MSIQKKKPSLSELIEQALNMMSEHKVVFYVIQSFEGKEVISNSNLYHFTKDGGEFSFLWTPTPEQINKVIPNIKL
jgi:hypothetical protein